MYKNIFSIALSALVLAGCGGGSGVSSNKEPVVVNKNYNLKVVDDPIVNATIDTKGVCSSFRDLKNGNYELIDCSKIPELIVARGGFVDLNADSSQDNDEITLEFPLSLKSASVNGNNLVVTPLSTLLSNLQSNESQKDIASKLGLNESDFYSDPSSNAKAQDFFRAINTIFIEAKNLGLTNEEQFLKDVRLAINEITITLGETPLQIAKKIREKIKEKSNSDDYLKNYGIIFSEFPSIADTAVTSKKHIQDLATNTKVASGKIDFLGYIYDDIISDATIELYKVDTNTGNEVKIDPSKITVKDGSATLNDNDKGKWEITTDDEILKSDQVIIFRGSATKASNNIIFDSAFSSKTLRTLYKNKVNTSSLSDINITNITSAKLALIKRIDPLVLRDIAKFNEKKILVEKNANLKEILKISSATIKHLIDNDLPLKINNVTQTNSKVFTTTLIDKLIDRIYGSSADLTAVKEDESKKANLDDNLFNEIVSLTSITKDNINTQITNISKNKTLNDQLTSTKLLEDFTLEKKLFDDKILKISLNAGGLYTIELFESQEFRFTENSTIKAGKWLIENNQLVLKFGNTEISKLSFDSLNLKANGAYLYHNLNQDNFSIQNFTDMTDAQKANKPDVKEPVFTKQTIRVQENQTYVTKLEASDSNSFTYTLSGADAALFEIEQSSGIVTFKTAPDYETKNTYSFSIIATDTNTNTNTLNLTVLINDIADVVPVIENSTVNVAENAALGVKVGDITITKVGDTSINQIRLDGIGSEFFEVSNSGEVKVKRAGSFDYETTKVYNLTAIATNSAGNSIQKDLTVNVTNIPEFAPTLADTTLNVDENSSTGTNVGNINITNPGDSPIIEISFTGVGSENFQIDTNGLVKVKAGANLNYESVTTYNFSVTARNTTGNSNTINLVININNLNENEAVLQNASFTIKEDIAINDTVGNVVITSSGDSAISSMSLTGSGNENFKISNTGVVSVKEGASIDYETTTSYSLQAIAINSAGPSSPVSVNITVTNVFDIVPTLTSTTLSIDENSKAPASVGNLTISSQGDSAISSIILSGTGNENFEITTAGAITVKAGATLNLEKVTSYNLSATALNQAGSSASVPLIINVLNVAEANVDFYVKNDNFSSGTIDTAGNATDVAISNDNNTAFIADKDNGLVIVDIKDPANPKILSTYNSFSARDVVLSKDGTKAFVADHSRGLLVLNITNLNSPMKLAELATSGAALEIILSDDESKAYIANSTNLAIFDISDVNNGNVSSLGRFTDTNVQSIALSSDESKVFILNSRDNNIRVVNVSDPSSISSIKTHNTSGINHKIKLSSDDSKLFIANGNDGLNILNVSNLNSISQLRQVNTDGSAVGLTLSNSENQVFVADSSNGIVVVDVTNASAANILSTYSVLGNSINLTLSKSGAMAYVAADTNGLAILNVANLTSPNIIAKYTTSKNVSKVHISKDKTKAFIANGDNFAILDISNTKSITTLDSHTITNITDFIISDDETKAYITGDINSSTNGLEILNIADKSNISSLGDISTLGSALGVALFKNTITMKTTAFIADNSNGLVAYDVSNPSSIPAALGNFKRSDAKSVILSKDGTKAFIATGANGIEILNISNPSSIGFISFHDTDNAKALSLSSDENKLFVADGSNGLVVFDISSPSSPSQVGTFDTRGLANGVALSKDDTKAHISDDANGITILDVSNLSSISLIGVYNTTGKANQLVLTDNDTKAYVAAGTSGGFVIENLQIDTFYKSADFTGEKITIKINPKQTETLSLDVSLDVNNVISLGSYDQTLSFIEYNGKEIDIPINAISGQSGKVVVSITVSNGEKSETREVHINVSK